MAQQIPKYELLPEDKVKEMLKDFQGERTGFVWVGPKKYLFPYRYIEQGTGFINFKIRPNDTFVTSYPRSGTTLTMELTWLLENNLDFQTAQKKLLSERFPFLEFSLFTHPKVVSEFLKMNEGDSTKEQLCREIAKPGYEIVAAIPASTPRFIKTHFPLSMLPGILDIGCKIIYVARNPKDVCVSWYHLNRAIKTQGFVGDFATFWNYFESDLTPWSPYWAHVLEAWNLKDHRNLLFIFYEEMMNDFPKAIKKVAKFLDKTYSDEEIDKIAKFLCIQNFRENAMVNMSELKACGIIEEGNFIRKGGLDGWKDMFTPKLNARADVWIEKNLKDSDLRFPIFQ